MQDCFYPLPHRREMPWLGVYRDLGTFDQLARLLHCNPDLSLQQVPSPNLSSIDAQFVSTSFARERQSHCPVQRGQSTDHRCRESIFPLPRTIHPATPGRHRRRQKRLSAVQSDQSRLECRGHAVSHLRSWRVRITVLSVTSGTHLLSACPYAFRHGDRDQYCNRDHQLNEPDYMIQ